MAKPSATSKKKPLLDATFACLSVYLGSLVSFQVDFFFAYDEIKKILMEHDREDLWIIIEEKLPFVSLPPQEMFPGNLKSPISPYYVIKQDEELVLGELYPSVHLSKIVTNLKSRFFCFFSYEDRSMRQTLSDQPVSVFFVASTRWCLSPSAITETWGNLFCKTCSPSVDVRISMISLPPSESSS